MTATFKIDSIKVNLLLDEFDKQFKLYDATDQEIDVILAVLKQRYATLKIAAVMRRLMGIYTQRGKE